MPADHYGDYLLRWQLQSNCHKAHPSEEEAIGKALGLQVWLTQWETMCLVARVQFPSTDPRRRMHRNKGTTDLVRRETECMVPRRRRKFRGQVEPLAETDHPGCGAVEVRNDLS